MGKGFAIKSWRYWLLGVCCCLGVAGPVRARARLLEPGESQLGTLRISAEAGISDVSLAALQVAEGGDGS